MTVVAFRRSREKRAQLLYRVCRAYVLRDVREARMNIKAGKLGLSESITPGLWRVHIIQWTQALRQAQDRLTTIRRIYFRGE